MYHSSSKNKKGLLAEINVVPYIDVMLVLLVIFMITTPLLTQGVNVKLPQAPAKMLTPKELPIVVSVDAQGNYFLNIADQPHRSITPEQLMTRVTASLTLAKQRHQSRDIYVKGDRDVNYGKVIEAMVLLQRAGADTVGLMTQSPSATPARSALSR